MKKGQLASSAAAQGPVPPTPAMLKSPTPLAKLQGWAMDREEFHPGVGDTRVTLWASTVCLSPTQGT